MRSVVNIIHFIRGCEPRFEMDLEEPVREQARLADQYGLPVTWLVQYDALLRPGIVALLRERLRRGDEVGLWIEIVQPLCEKCDIRWRGRFPWDWYADVGFSIGYPPEERERLADELVRRFRTVFGCMPRSAGSWFMDAHMYAYLVDRHGICGGCNCRDQYGTDGYSLWGGYWANGYYPSRSNSFLPGASESSQIPAPIFRMLGSDPIYQYSASPDTPNGQPVITLEPACGGGRDLGFGGGSPDWVHWFLENLSDMPSLGLSYAQMGQENAFPWRKTERSWKSQLECLDRMRREGKIEVELLADTAAWFLQNYRTTPATCVSALSDWRGEGRQALWFLSKRHRMGFVVEAGRLMIRDWQCYSDAYAERYLSEVCTTHDCLYDALPLADQIRHPGSELCWWDGMTGRITEVGGRDGEMLRFVWRRSDGRELVFEVDEQSFRVFCGVNGGILSLPEKHGVLSADGKCFTASHCGFFYGAKVAAGRMSAVDGGTWRVAPDVAGRIEIMPFAGNRI